MKYNCTLLANVIYLYLYISIFISFKSSLFKFIFLNFNFWVHWYFCFLGFKEARVGSHSWWRHTWYTFLRFISGVTPLPVCMATTADDHFSHMYILTEVGCETRMEDLLLNSQTCTQHSGRLVLKVLYFKNYECLLKIQFFDGKTCLQLFVNWIKALYRRSSLKVLWSHL